MGELPRSPWIRYGLPVLFVALALTLSLAVNLAVEIHDPYLFFSGAIVLSAFCGGIRAGILATLLSGGVIHYFFVPPIYSFQIPESRWLLQLMLFTGEGTLLSVFTGVLRIARTKLLASRRQRYGAALLAFAIIFVLKFSLQSLASGGLSFTLFYLAVVLAARFGGLGPALLVTFLVGATVPYCFLEPRFSFQIASTVSAVRLVMFLVESVLISLVSSTLYTAREEAEKQAEEIRRQQQLLVEAGQRYHLLIDGVHDYAIFMLDAEGRVATWNQGGERIFGYTDTEILGRHYQCFATAEDQAAGRPFEELSKAAAEGRWEGTGYRARSDGKHLWAEVIVTACRDHADKLQSFSTVLRDITEQKQVQEQLRQSEERLRQAQRLESLGRLAGGVAHDVNNLLTVIEGYSELLFETAPQSGLAEEAAREIRQAVERAADLTQQLLTFSRGQKQSPTVLDLNRLTADIGNMLRRLLGATIELVTDLQPDLGHVKADRGQLEQVLVNLAVNARDAMPRGGRLTIATANVVRQHPEPGNYVLLMFQDTGIGMDEETRSHVFDPFFTTKELGKGTGLGLSTVFGIVSQSGGSIEVDSAPGQGAVFRVYLPRCDEALPASPAPLLTPPSPK